MDLTSIELRILAGLIEKQISTPEYYPLSMNALINACNQKSNRNPVVEYNEIIVETGLGALKMKELARKVYDGAGRVPKYTHLFHQRFNLKRNLVAILVELMLRGPQTPGELKSKCRRLHVFENVEEVVSALDELMNQEEPMVCMLARVPGSREMRHTHTFSDEPLDITSSRSSSDENVFDSSCPPTQVISDDQVHVKFESTIRRMEVEIISLRKELSQIRQEISDLKNAREFR
jgi:uncharacterized protein YceH (UPF0502 family)